MTCGTLVGSENVIVESRLPETTSRPLRVVKACLLLPCLYKTTEIRGCGLAFNQQVQMVGHEAVREDTKVVGDRGAPNLPQNPQEQSSISKRAAAFMSANCQ